MQVKKWIREGRIEYKDDHLNTITMHCTRSGAPISFGTLCAKCMRQKDVSVHSSAREDVSDSRMRFIEDMVYYSKKSPDRFTDPGHLFVPYFMTARGYFTMTASSISSSGSNS